MSYDAEYYRQYRLKNKKRIAEKDRKCRKNNPDKVEVIRQRQKESGYTAKYQKQYRKTIACKYSVLKSRAKQRGIAFCIDKTEFFNWFAKQQQKCIYCGVDTTMGLGQNRKTWLTIDRMDNDKSYILDNIVISCYRCNILKADDISYKTMIKIGQLITKKSIIRYGTTRS